MKQLLYLYLILLTSVTLAQEPAETAAPDIEAKDLSHLWLNKFPISHEGKEYKRPEPVGYFGEDYQRFFMHFISIIQNPSDKSEYLIYGKTRLKGKISEIQGILKIEEIEVHKEEPETGIIQGTYHFYEDSKEKGSGIFDGVFKSYFMLVDNQIHYDTTHWYADGYENNQFEGSWTSYTAGKSYVCNWGDYRIPNRRGFDIGAGQMGVDSKYIENGWENFELATFPIANSEEHRKQIEAAKKKEAEVWWK
ncbi:MAG: hypothetical protein HEP71_13000 [Roseivirga sp.]|nr:hypothetical protein [Roseivirga sp.]